MEDTPEPEDEQTYKIVRFHHPSLNKENEVTQTGLTLTEAREHCDSPDSKCSEWFEGYARE
jgi:hypothetical protein